MKNYRNIFIALVALLLVVCSLFKFKGQPEDVMVVSDDQGYTMARPALKLDKLQALKKAVVVAKAAEAKVEAKKVEIKKLTLTDPKKNKNDAKKDEDKKANELKVSSTDTSRHDGLTVDPSSYNGNGGGGSASNSGRDNNNGGNSVQNPQAETQHLTAAQWLALLEQEPTDATANNFITAVQHGDISQAEYIMIIGTLFKSTGADQTVAIYILSEYSSVASFQFAADQYKNQPSTVQSSLQKILYGYTYRLPTLAAVLKLSDANATSYALQVVTYAVSQLSSVNTASNSGRTRTNASTNSASSLTVLVPSLQTIASQTNNSSNQEAETLLNEIEQLIKG